MLNLPFIFVFVLIQCIDAAVPMVPLKNAAVEGLTMPATGLGLGGYGNNKRVGYGGYPECFAESAGCGEFTKKAISDWFAAGGRRLDSADSYGNEKSVGEAWRSSSINRRDLFILSKVGPSQPLGYNETLNQFSTIKANLQTAYVDLLLIHWPTSRSRSTDPACNHGSPHFNEKDCRISTWRAMIEIFNSGGAKAIGVSNYENSHIQEIMDAKLLVPSVNQCHFNPYGGSAQMDKVKFCKANDIVYLGYSPLGIPDWHKFPSGSGMSSTPLKDPTILSIASAHEKSAAQVIMAWEWSLGIPVNPRSQNAKHMAENLDIYNITISSAESAKIMALHQDTCEEDPYYYECAK